MMEIVAIAGVVLLALILFFLVYRAMRTYDAGAHKTFITTKGGEYYGAIRAPTILWNPMVKVLREKNAPDISIITNDATGTEYFEKSLPETGTDAKSSLKKCIGFEWNSVLACA